MEVEKNIVFIHPLSPRLVELLDDLNAKDEYMIFEVESLAEYGQIIGVLDQSITFSSDLKKTRTYIKDFKSFVKNKKSRNILVQENVLPPHIFSKLQADGLNENLKEDVGLKSLLHKVNMFFNATTSEVIDKKEAPQIRGNSSKETLVKVSSQTVIENNSQFDFDSNKRKKRKIYDFEKGSSFNLRRNKTDISFLQSPFDRLQRKNVSTFTPQLKNMDFKRVQFAPLAGELKNNPFRKSLELKAAGELNKKQGQTFEDQPVENEDPKKKLELPVLGEKKRKKFDPFQETDRLAPKRKQLNLPELKANVKKRGRFQEVLRKSPERKKFEEYQKDRKKKKGTFEEVKRSLERKQVDTPEKKKSERKGGDYKADEMGDLKGNLRNIEFPEREGKKAKNKFEEVKKELEKKKKLLEEVGKNRQKLQKKFEEVDVDPKKKKEFHEIERELNGLKNKFEEQIKELELTLELKEEAPAGEIQDKRTDDEILDNKVDLSQILLESSTNNKKKTLDKKQQDSGEDFDEKLLDYSKIKKGSGVTVLDYRKILKDHKEGKISLNEEAKKAVERKMVDSLCEEEDFLLFPFESYGIEYLITYGDLVFTMGENGAQLCKFVHFSLIREFEGDVLFLLQQENGVLERFYVGDNYRYHEIEDYIGLNLDKWSELKLPVWKDETFQTDRNEFYYPYFEDGQYLGVAVANFNGSIKTREDAQKVEILMMMARGLMFQESNL